MNRRVLAGCAVAASAALLPQTAAATPGREAVSGPVVVQGRARALVGDRVTVDVDLPAAARGTSVRLRWRRGGRSVAVDHATVAGPPGAAPHVRATLRVPAAGTLRLSLSADGATTDELLRTICAYRVTPLRPMARRVVRARLARLGYVAPSPSAAEMRRGVLAFQKVHGLARTGSLSVATLHALVRHPTSFPVRFPDHGRHVEADLSMQVLAEILPGGRVERVFPVSSGKPSTPTIRGHFRVYRRQPGTNGEGMVDTSYFSGGYGIHGYASVPSYAASHGCLRVFVADAPRIYDWIRLGTRVDVFA